MDTGRAARTRGQLDLTAWSKSPTAQRVKAGVEPGKKPETRESELLRVRGHPLLLLDHTAKMCILKLLHALAVAVLPHGRSGLWKRAGLPVAVRVLPAEPPGENPHSGNIFFPGGFSSAFVHYFWIFFLGRENLEVDVFDGEEEKSLALLLTTASSVSSSAAQRPDRFILRTFREKKKQQQPTKQTNKKTPKHPPQKNYCSFVKAVFKC